MSQFDDDDSKPWTEHDLKEAIRRINAGEINFKEAEDYYGISPRTIHRQRAIENMRAQLNPEKAKKTKPNPSSSTRKDVSVLRKPVDISCTSISDVVTLLDTGTEEVKQLLNYECDLIYECKVCKNLFRSLVNFISHKRVYCCDMYSVLHTRTDDGENGSVTNELQMGDKIKSKENVKEFTAKPFRITCRKDLTSVLKRITSLTEFAPTEPVLKIEHLESSPHAYQQTLVNCSSSDANDPNKSTAEQLTDNVETSPEAESKTESTATAPKVPEKPAAAPTNSSGYVAEKRFRCPVCAVNFTIKKSVMRHLKAVHNQSPEQMERLKPRIQMHYVRRKTSVAENKSSPPDKKSSPVANKSKPEKEQTKSEWQKTCATCNRLFINRNSFAAHSRACQRLAAANREADVDSSRTSITSGRSLQPVVSLTPLSHHPERTERSNDSVPATTSSSPAKPDSTNKKPTAAAPSKKLEASLPALSSTPSSTCKKIGIQVRMNYGKANANPTATSSGVNGSAPSSVFPSAPISVATSSSSSSANNSRRSSFAAPTVKSEDQTSSGQQSSITRSSSSGAVLAHILETLLDKKGLAKEQSVAAVTTSTGCATATVTVASSSAQKSTLCSDTKKATADKECATQASAARRKLPNDKRQLLPHPNAKNAVISETELAQVQSSFVAERRGSQSECHGAAKKKNANDKTDTSATALPRRASVSSSNLAAPASQTSAASKSSQPSTKAQSSAKAPPPAKAQQPSKAPAQKSVTQPQRTQSAPSLKRKLTTALPSLVQTALPAKRKPLNVRQSSISPNEPPAVKTEVETVAQSASADVTTPMAVKRENVGDSASAPAAQASVVVKKSKKTPVATAPATLSALPKTPTADSKNRLFPRIKIRQTPDKPLVNGIGSTVTYGSSSSSDEENDLPSSVAVTAQTTGSKAKANLRKPFETALTAPELKPTKTPPSSAKVVNCNNELSSSSSTPDSDLDPSTLTEENLKKSIMTIIFGKDIPTEKMEEREKSPTSSCTSSDSGKEKRYSVRIAKQSTSTKNIVPVVDCRDDKVTKIAIPAKVKATR